VKLAIVANVLTPYRVYFHRRLQQEVTGLDLHTLLTSGPSPLPWQMDVSDLKVVRFPVAETARTGRIARFWRDWRIGRAILDYFYENEIDAAAVNGYSDLARLRVIAGCWRISRPVLLRADSNIRGDRQISSARRLAKKAVISWATARCEALLVMGELGREFFEVYGTEGVPMFTVPYDLDVAAFHRAEPQDVLDFCSQHGLDPTRSRMIYVGRLVPVKAVEDLLAAFVNVAPDRQNWDLVIAGSGPLEGELKATVPQDLRHRVSWLGFVDHDSLPSAYHACHLFVLPSLKEPWGVVVTEALAAGLPVVASDAVGAAHELLRDGKGGAIFAASNVGDLVEKLRYATSPGGWQKLAAEVPGSFNRWRSQADPVMGLLKALESVTGYVGPSKLGP